MSESRIFLVDATQKKLRPMPAMAYINEGELQVYLATYPDLLPGDQINPEDPRRWLLVSRELGIPGEEGGSNIWSLDHLFIDQDGIPTFVECKRVIDSRSRREVVAQMLDYAANAISYWDPYHLRQAATQTAQVSESTLDELMLNLLGTNDSGAVELFWEKVEQNLRAGKIRLLFVLDEAPPALRRLVEFLNQKMVDVEVLIVEVKQFQGADQVALVSRVLGVTETTRATKSANTKPLSRPEFFEKCQPIVAKVFEEIIAAAEQRNFTIQWKIASFAISVRVPYSNLDIEIVKGWTRQNISVYFKDLCDKAGLPNEVETRWRAEWIDTGLFMESGTYLSGVPIDFENAEPMKIQVFRFMDCIVEHLRKLEGHNKQLV